MPKTDSTFGVSRVSAAKGNALSSSVGAARSHRLSWGVAALVRGVEEVRTFATKSEVQDGCSGVRGARLARRSGGLVTVITPSSVFPIRRGRITDTDSPSQI